MVSIIKGGVCIGSTECCRFVKEVELNAGEKIWSAPDGGDVLGVLVVLHAEDPALEKRSELR